MEIKTIHHRMVLLIAPQPPREVGNGTLLRMDQGTACISRQVHGCLKYNSFTSENLVMEIPRSGACS